MKITALTLLLLLHGSTALVAPPSFGTRALKSAGRRHGSQQLNMLDPTIMVGVAGSLAVPTVFVGTGTFLLAGGEEEEEEEKDPDAEVDIYRDTLLRYAGYANEVGEAFAPLVPAVVVPASYGVAITYVVADTVDKTRKAYSGGKYATAITNCAVIEGFDALVWQLAASVALPGYTIHQIVGVAVTILDSLGLNDGPLSALPTAIGLLTIPFIVKPLDELAEVGMDVTLRKLWGPYLESCEVTYD